MEKHMKRLFVISCLFTLLFLTACGTASHGKAPSAASNEPEETATPAVTEPSAPQENAVAQDSEPAVKEEPGPDGNAAGEQNQTPQSASGSFTGAAGTVFVVPDGFIQLDESPSIGYQYTFWHPDYEIRIAVCEIAPGAIPEGAYETDCSIAANNSDVTYFKNGDNWFVQSGYNNNGEEIFYSKETLTDTGLKTFWITYPTAKREFGDAISAEFEKNCQF